MLVSGKEISVSSPIDTSYPCLSSTQPSNVSYSNYRLVGGTISVERLSRSDRPYVFDRLSLLWMLLAVPRTVKRAED
jgi:hypothetical protein